MSLSNRMKDIFKPPAVVFFITATFLALILLIYAISLYLSGMKMKDPDIQRWTKLRDSISKLGICLLVNQIGKNQLPKSHSIRSTLPSTFIQMANTSSDSEGTTTINFLANVDLFIDEIKQRGYFVKANVKAENLGFRKGDEVVELVMSNRKDKGNTNDLTCISITGPQRIVPTSSLANCKQPKDPPKQYLFLMPMFNVKNEEFCPSKHYGNITLREDQDLEIYLPQEEMEVITVHILVTGMFLSSFVVIFILYSLVKLLCLASCESKSSHLKFSSEM